MGNLYLWTKSLELKSWGRVEFEASKLGTGRYPIYKECRNKVYGNKGVGEWYKRLESRNVEIQEFGKT